MHHHQCSSVLSHLICAPCRYPRNHVWGTDQEPGLVKAYERLLPLAPENEDQAGEGGREASVYWFAMRSDGQGVDSETTRLAQD